MEKYNTLLYNESINARGQGFVLDVGGIMPVFIQNEILNAVGKEGVLGNVYIKLVLVLLIPLVTLYESYNTLSNLIPGVMVIGLVMYEDALPEE